MRPSVAEAKPNQDSAISEQKAAPPSSAQLPEDTAEDQVQRDEQIRRLQERDAEVRAHEQAHFAFAGSYARGGPNYEYETGPDGKRYAVRGHVNIDIGPVPGDARATIQKAQQLRRAALAPAEPSGADRAIAAKAAAMERRAMARLQAEASEAASEGFAETAMSDETASDDAAAARRRLLAVTDGPRFQSETLRRLRRYEDMQVGTPLGRLAYASERSH